MIKKHTDHRTLTAIQLRPSWLEKYTRRILTFCNMFEKPTSRQLVFCNPLIEDLLLHILAEEKLSHIFSRSTFKTLFEHSVLIYSLLKLYFSEKQISRVPKFSEINFPNFSWEVDKKKKKKKKTTGFFFFWKRLITGCYFLTSLSYSGNVAGTL